MGILEKNKKSTHKSAFNSTTSSNVYKNGSKKASYSLSIHKESENIDPKEKNNEILAEQDEIYHDNPAFEPELANQEQIKNPFDTESSKKGSLTNESFQLETHNQTSISTLASISNTEKLAAAAAAAVSSTAASLVEVPNFGQELSTMMKQNRMDEIEIGSKKTDSSIVQNSGFAYGDGGSMNKNMKKSPSSNAIGDLATLDDDAKLKLTGTSASYDIKIRQRRACHLKVLVILVAMLTAGFIGCIFTYYYMRYQIENQKYLSYTQNMVLERASKLGSNKLEIVVPFGTNVTDINDKNILVNKIEEIVHQTFTRMNKTVDLMQLFELNEIAANWYVATIDVELKDASDFSNVVLRKESETRIKIDDSSDVLKAFRDNFLNVTLGLNIIPEILSINVSSVEILYDFKMIYAKLNGTEPTRVTQTNEAFAKEKIMPNAADIQITKTNSPKLLSSIVSSTPSIVSESAIYFASSPPQPETGVFASTPSIPPSTSSQVFEPLSAFPALTTSPVFFPNGVSRILSTTMSLGPDTSNSVEPSFSPKIREENIELINYKTQNDKTKFKSLKNDKEIEENSKPLSTPVLPTDVSTNKILIAEILLNNEEEFDSSSQDAKNEPKVNNFPLKSSSTVSSDHKDNNGLDIVLQIDGNDSSLLNRLFEKKNRK